MCLSRKERNTLRHSILHKIECMTEQSLQVPIRVRNTWYALRTFHRLEHKVSLFLEENHLQHFVPMVYSTKMAKPKKEEEEENDPMKPELVPAVHNLLFVKKTISQRQMEKILSECTTPVSIFRQPGDRRLCEISDRDMLEFRMLCDPKFEQSIFMTQGEAEALVGKKVQVIAGPFQGLVGKLIRKKKQYYFLKSVVGVGVMVRISRWYCAPIP